MKPFRWTRVTYKRARHLERLFQHIYIGRGVPRLVEQLWELRRDHPVSDDPLNRPIWMRLDEKRRADSGIPF